MDDLTNRNVRDLYKKKTIGLSVQLFNRAQVLGYVNSAEHTTPDRRWIYRTWKQMTVFGLSLDTFMPKAQRSELETLDCMCVCCVHVCVLCACVCVFNLHMCVWKGGGGGGAYSISEVEPT